MSDITNIKKDISQTVAENLKAIRTKKHLSLDAVSTLSGVSKSMLAQIERGDVNPTISIVWKIANGLKVSFTSIVEPQREDTEIIPKNQIEQLIEDGGKFINSPIFKFSDKYKFETFRVELLPGGTRSSDAHFPGTEEFVTVYKGTIIITAGDESYTLHEGDSIRYRADAPHSYTNPGPGTTDIHMVIFYGE